MNKSYLKYGAASLVILVALGSIVHSLFANPSSEPNSLKDTGENRQLFESVPPPLPAPTLAPALSRLDERDETALRDILAQQEKAQEINDLMHQEAVERLKASIAQAESERIDAERKMKPQLPVNPQSSPRESNEKSDQKSKASEVKEKRLVKRTENVPELRFITIDHVVIEVGEELITVSGENASADRYWLKGLSADDGQASVLDRKTMRTYEMAMRHIGSRSRSRNRHSIPANTLASPTQNGESGPNPPELPDLNYLPVGQ